MKTKVTALVLTMLVAPMAQAGLYDLWLPGPFSPFGSLKQSESTLRFMKSIVPEVPVSVDCTPLFTAGDDGLFRRTPYCHRANPSEPRGYLGIGYDVPATFLTGFTEADVLASWNGAQVKAPQIFGSMVEVPTVLLTALNLKAAEAWQKVLGCAKQNPDLAREMYRLNDFDCAEKDRIRLLIGEIHLGLLTLAGSTEGHRFLGPKGIEGMLEDLKERRARLIVNVSPLDYERVRQEIARLLDQELDLMRLRLQAPGSKMPSLRETLHENRQQLPRMHPLLVQIMFEELLSMVSPDDGAWSAARRIKGKDGQKAFFLQLLLWGRSIADFGCASFGLWPSANRVAVEAFGDKAIEIWRHLGGPSYESSRAFDQIACPAPRNVRGEPLKIGGQLYDIGQDDPNHISRRMMRLNDVYTQGRAQAWREVRELRDRYVTPAK